RVPDEHPLAARTLEVPDGKRRVDRERFPVYVLQNDEHSPSRQTRDYTIAIDRVNAGRSSGGRTLAEGAELQHRRLVARGEFEDALELLAGSQGEPPALVETAQAQGILDVPRVELGGFQVALLGHPLPARLRILALALAQDEVEARVLGPVRDGKLRVLDAVVVVALAHVLPRLRVVPLGDAVVLVDLLPRLGPVQLDADEQVADAPGGAL